MAVFGELTVIIADTRRFDLGRVVAKNIFAEIPPHFPT